MPAANIFFSLDHVYEVTLIWKDDYNGDRPHEALNFCTPNEDAAGVGFLKAYASESVQKGRRNFLCLPFILVGSIYP